MRQDNFISVKPNLKLEKYVDCYYFHSCNYAKSNLKYTYYPHVKHAITIYKDSVAETKGSITTVKPRKSSYSALYSTIREHPHQVNIKGSFKKVGIIFKPYGINHFIKKPLKEVCNAMISNFEEWNSDLDKLTEDIWTTEDINSRALVLNTFLSHQKTENTNKLFSEIISKIIKSDTIESIQKISNNHNLNRKTLYRMFLRELDCSPSKFLKILRFRKSLEAYLKKQDINLTEAAVTQFYDQSDFIKNVKQITSTTPKQLTQEISDLENAIFWKIQ